MAKKCYIGVGDVARKVNKGYVGVDSVARKIKKAYIGVGNVARPFWSGGTPTYYGTITSLSKEKYSLAATTVGDYAIFGGGQLSGSKQYTNTVDAYNVTLTKSELTALELSSSDLAATAVGNYALFAGGHRKGAINDDVTSYNTSLTRTLATSLTIERWDLAATTVGNYALFGGGFTDNSSYITQYDTSYTNTVEAYNSSLTQTIPIALTYGVMAPAATTVGNYALFGGGHSSSSALGVSDFVQSYDASLTRNFLSQGLSLYVEELAATTVGNYALFGGGASYTGYSNAVDAFNTSLTKTTVAALPLVAISPSATTLGDYAMFIGGYTGASYIADATTYDSSLTQRAVSGITTGRYRAAATTVGNYALFAGGQYVCGTVDAYTIA